MKHYYLNTIYIIEFQVVGKTYSLDTKASFFYSNLQISGFDSHKYR